MQAKFQQILSIFYFGAHLGLTDCKYFIKFIFDFNLKSKLAYLKYRLG